ncbi:uncharacterized protein LOC114531404 [Dendronephthya gigantea]|uniref:uncharacterized protein LOC114531404 n=1 Tax=Dendronephthya gigantea TaxID=151771 RepID=UPI00106A5FA0|nr:uncharacterized protein LOC114531404 [Dendronephthya gigantea]
MSKEDFPDKNDMDKPVPSTQSDSASAPKTKPDSSDITCFVHCVSPVKASGSTKYFNCNLQAEGKVFNAVCFAPQKWETLDSHAKQKSPVKIRKYQTSNKFGKDDVIINKYTSIVLTITSLEYKDLKSPTTIASLSQTTPGQLVTVTGYVAHLSATKVILMPSGALKKQEGFLVDPTGSIKLVLWRSHTDTIEVEKTYTFNQLRLKFQNSERYLNTPKADEDCKISPTSAFKESLPAADMTSSVKEIMGSIIGVNSVSKHPTCLSCSSKVIIKCSGQLAECSSCKMTTKLSMCKYQWFMRLLVQNAENTNERIHLSGFNSSVEKLASVSKIDLVQITEAELTEALLNLEMLQLSYDTRSKKILDIEKIDL